MQSEKTVKIIDAVRNMTDHEADLLEVFISGFQAGKQISGQEIRNEPAIAQGSSGRMNLHPKTGLIHREHESELGVGINVPQLSTTKGTSGRLNSRKQGNWFPRPRETTICP